MLGRAKGWGKLGKDGMWTRRGILSMSNTMKFIWPGVGCGGGGVGLLYSCITELLAVCCNMWARNSLPREAVSVVPWHFS